VLGLVLGCHVAALALTLAQSAEPLPAPQTITPPPMTGIMLPPQVDAPQPQAKPMPAPKAQPQPQPQPKPQQKPQPTAKPLPKAAPSEKAVSTPPVSPPPTSVSKARTAAPATMPAPMPKTPVIQPPSAEALGLNNKAPIYPQLSRKKKEQGTVLLLILVKADGTVGEIKLQTSSGYSRLDQAAKQAVKHWQFQPAQQDGKNIDFWYELPLKFQLNQH
jgi:protein TonB